MLSHAQAPPLRRSRSGVPAVACVHTLAHAHDMRHARPHRDDLDAGLAQLLLADPLLVELGLPVGHQAHLRALTQTEIAPTRARPLHETRQNAHKDHNLSTRQNPRCTCPPAWRAQADQGGLDLDLDLVTVPNLWSQFPPPPQKTLQVGQAAIPEPTTLNLPPNVPLPVTLSRCQALSLSLPSRSSPETPAP
eukprot:4881189-Pleurochrysis_carterae.AAC.1